MSTAAGLAAACLALAAPCTAQAQTGVDEQNVLRAFAALQAIGSRPSVPVTASEFADPAVRSGWIRDKGMQVLQFWSDAHRETPIDMFVTEPFDLEHEYSRTLLKRLQDQLDIENLRTIESDDGR